MSRLRWYIQTESGSGRYFVAPTTEPIYKMEKQGFEVYRTYRLARNRAISMCRNAILVQLENIMQLSRGHEDDWAGRQNYRKRKVR